MMKRGGGSVSVVRLPAVAAHASDVLAESCALHAELQTCMSWWHQVDAMLAARSASVPASPRAVAKQHAAQLRAEYMEGQVAVMTSFAERMGEALHALYTRGRRQGEAYNHHRVQHLHRRLQALDVRLANLRREHAVLVARVPPPPSARALQRKSEEIARAVAQAREEVGAARARVAALRDTKSANAERVSELLGQTRELERTLGRCKRGEDPGLALQRARDRIATEREQLEGQLRALDTHHHFLKKLTHKQRRGTMRELLEAKMVVQAGQEKMVQRREAAAAVAEEALQWRRLRARLGAAMRGSSGDLFAGPVPPLDAKRVIDIWQQVAARAPQHAGEEEEEAEEVEDVTNALELAFFEDVDAEEVDSDVPEQPAAAPGADAQRAPQHRQLPAKESVGAARDAEATMPTSVRPRKARDGKVRDGKARDAPASLMGMMPRVRHPSKALEPGCGEGQRANPYGRLRAAAPR